MPYKNKEDKRAYDKRYRKNQKEKALEHYGKVCVCCGESNIMFLTIDHIHGGGQKHRKKDPGAVRIIEWLTRKGFPSGYQVMCFNCNCARAFNNGICPHETARLATIVIEDKLRYDITVTINQEKHHECTCDQV